MLGVIEQASRFSGQTATIESSGVRTYRDLLHRSAQLAGMLLQGSNDLSEARVAFMVEPGFDYVAALWGIWRAGGIAVPICISHPAPAITHVIADTGAKVILAAPGFHKLLKPLAADHGAELKWMVESVESEDRELPETSPDRRAMILYTSGTTSLPKGVVTTHRNLEAQITTLVSAWQWRNTDHVLCVLPLHHVHGIVNVVCCSLWSGARCEFMREFDPMEVLATFDRGEISVFMAVPTIYYKLIAAWEKLRDTDKESIAAAMRRMRLMVSGSAALPVSVMARWEEISGHRLLERYGMTELGMAISNPYHGERRAGSVGKPLPGVDVRLCNEADQLVVREPGEIQVRGGNVFLEYWQQPEATRKSFTHDGWFKTGDVGVLEDGYYRILGRNSVDIIKSGGYKISALEIEEVLRTHPDVMDCAVVGLEDVEWGEIVAAALVGQGQVDLSGVSSWMKERIPAYKMPRKFLVVEELPRNAMGKVTKNSVKKLFAE